MTFKVNLHFLTLSHLFQFVENVKCKQISLELNSWGPHSSLERERNIHCFPGNDPGKFKGAGGGAGVQHASLNPSLF